MGKATNPRTAKLSVVPKSPGAVKKMADLMDLAHPPVDPVDFGSSPESVRLGAGKDEQEQVEDKPEPSQAALEKLCQRHWDTMQVREDLLAKAAAKGLTASPVDPKTDITLPDCQCELGSPGVPKDHIFSGVPEDYPGADGQGRFPSVARMLDKIHAIKPGPSWEDRDPTKPGADEEFRVALMRDHKLVYPDLWLSVFVAGSRHEEAQFAEMFTRAACYRAESLEKADICVFTGGPDVDPQMYGEKPHYTFHGSESRDTEDINLYLYCMERGIPMLGICRGAQFLWVMSGGKLYQDVDHHNGDHTMWDVQKARTIERVSSVHHQMCMMDEKMMKESVLLGTSTCATKRWKNPLFFDEGNKADVEAFFIRDTCCIGIQGHPEYRGYNYFAKWTLEQINEYVILNPDIDWKDGNRRIKDDLLAQRGNGPTKLIIPAAAETKEK